MGNVNQSQKNKSKNKKKSIRDKNKGLAVSVDKLLKQLTKDSVTMTTLNEGSKVELTDIDL